MDSTSSSDFSYNLCSIFLMTAYSLEVSTDPYSKLFNNDSTPASVDPFKSFSNFFSVASLTVNLAPITANFSSTTSFLPCFVAVFTVSNSF